MAADTAGQGAEDGASQIALTGSYSFGLWGYRFVMFSGILASLIRVQGLGLRVDWLVLAAQRLGVPDLRVSDDVTTNTLQ